MLLAMICFGPSSTSKHDYQCDEFNGSNGQSAHYLTRSSFYHHWGCLSYYNGNPTAVGGYHHTKHQSNKAESYTSTGWNWVPDHPEYKYLEKNPIITFYQGLYMDTLALALTR